MANRGTFFAGLLAGGLLLALGLALILARDWAWSLFEQLYGLLGVQGERTHMREMFISTIGLGVSAIGLAIVYAAWQRRRP